MADVKFAFICCNHAVLTHQPWWDWMRGELEDFKPDYLVHGGDWFEALAASRWGKRPDQKWTLRDEFEAVARQARDLNASLSDDCKKVWLYGNHDDNLFNEPFRMPEDLQELVRAYRDNYEFRAAFEDWNVIDKYGARVRYRLGPITFQHGAVTGTALTEGFLKDQAYAHSTPWGLHLSGHTHSPVQVTQCRERKSYLPYWYANVGCGVVWEGMAYMNRASMEAWGRGLIIGTVASSAVEQRRTAYASKQWEAVLKVHSYASQNRVVPQELLAA
jgi:hypothetical protein